MPECVVDHESYRRWATSDKFPERGRFAYFAGRVWMDLETERSSHNLIKTEIAAVLTACVKRRNLGRYYGDNMLLSHPVVGLSTEPDGTYIAWETFRSGIVEQAGGEPNDGIELVGVPDMALEVISPTSVRKDTVELFEQYWRAGVGEYWLIDPRGDEPAYTLYAHAADGYRVVRPRGGWRKSPVFGASFRLVRSADPLGQAAYALEIL